MDCSAKVSNPQGKYFHIYIYIRTLYFGWRLCNRLYSTKEIALIIGLF